MILLFRIVLKRHFYLGSMTAFEKSQNVSFAFLRLKRPSKRLLKMFSVVTTLVLRSISMKKLSLKVPFPMTLRE